MTIAPDGRPPFRADHIGSLLRPPALRKAFREHAAGTLSEEGYAQSLKRGKIILMTIVDTLRASEAGRIMALVNARARAQTE